MAEVGANTKIHDIPRRIRAAIAALAGSSNVNIAVVWPQPFPNLNYTVALALEQDSGIGGDLGAAITARTTDGCTVNVANGALTQRSGTLHVTAQAD